MVVGDDGRDSQVNGGVVVDESCGAMIFGLRFVERFSLIRANLELGTLGLRV